MTITAGPALEKCARLAALAGELADEFATRAAEPLTAREREVVRLLAEGCIDQEIAAALAISTRTVGVHVQHVIAKLGVRSRWQVADWARVHGGADEDAR
jgi:DNA-binding NarL/FixJ family response regulator